MQILAAATSACKCHLSEKLYFDTRNLSKLNLSSSSTYLQHIILENDII